MEDRRDLGSMRREGSLNRATIAGGTSCEEGSVVKRKAVSFRDSGVSHRAGSILARVISEAIQAKQLFFVVLLPDETVVERRVKKRL